ncbi:MAG TPA: hypothetical protein DHW82_09705 [Spirochaetia bacterium]|nr:MAG: hypothetical protein A2Y41_00455 [Spirochaetes bacterium GWB1_36_13]HCL57266.1 hypothetical protein [Spirochaetia bacterium]
MKEKDLFICTSCFIIRADDVFMIMQNSCDIILIFKDEKKKPLSFTFDDEERACYVIEQAIRSLN